MSAGGQTANASVWAEGDVLIGTVDAEVPREGAPFDMDQWAYVGFLSGSDGFTESVAVESTDHFAWGGHLLATTRRNYKLTRQFTAYEENETVFDLLYPGHDVAFEAGGEYSGSVNVPDLQARFKVAFVNRTGGVLKHFISENYAQVEERGDRQDSEENLSSVQLTVAIYPGDADPETGKRPLAYVYKGLAGS